MSTYIEGETTVRNMLAFFEKSGQWAQTSTTNRKSTSLGLGSIYIIYIDMRGYLLICSMCFLGASANPRDVEAFARTWFLLLGTTKGDRYVMLGLRMVLEFRGSHHFWKDRGQTNINTARGYKTCGEPQIKEC